MHCMNFTGILPVDGPLEKDRTIGSNAHLSCSYTPSNFVWSYVRWDYKQSPADNKTLLYSYDMFQDVRTPNPDRYNYIHTDGKFTLVIHNLTESDAGDYYGTINKDTCHIYLDPIGK